MPRKTVENLPTALRKIVNTHGADQVTITVDAHTARALADAIDATDDPNLHHDRYKLSGKIF